MVEKAVLIKRLTYLEGYLKDLADVNQNCTWAQFSSDKIIRRYVERTLHMAIEACLDIANHIISYEGLREPTSNQDLFIVLGEANIISMEMVAKLKKMAQFRNVIVHDYIRINPEIVYAITVKHLDDLREYGLTIKEVFCSD